MLTSPDPHPVPIVAVAALEAAVASLPFVGPAVVSLMSEYRSERRLRNLERFVRELREGLEALRADSLDEAYARSPEYAEYVLRLAEMASTAYREQKIRLLAAVAAGASTGATSNLLLEKYLAAADAISVDHVEGLAKFQRGEMWVNHLDVRDQRMLSDEFPELDEAEVQVLIRDLATQGFVEDAGGSRLGVRSGDVWRITPLGISFLAFLKGRAEPDPESA